jgi:hypothetical protein
MESTDIPNGMFWILADSNKCDLLKFSSKSVP